MNQRRNVVNGTQKVAAAAVSWAGVIGLGVLAHYTGHLNNVGLVLLGLGGFLLNLFALFNDKE